MKPELKIKSRRYDEAFKRSAVEHWMVSGKSALDMALQQRRPTAGLVHHSDAVCNMPAPLTGSAWRRRASSPA